MPAVGTSIVTNLICVGAVRNACRDYYCVTIRDSVVLMPLTRRLNPFLCIISRRRALVPIYRRIEMKFHYISYVRFTFDKHKLKFLLFQRFQVQYKNSSDSLVGITIHYKITDAPFFNKIL